MQPDIEQRDYAKKPLTKEEVLALIHEAIEFHIEGLKADGIPVPPPTSQSELVDIAA